ncbi:MAG TPA: hypothetical protein ENG83_12150 [Nitrospirae bacterium]|nr:hypothetical protein BMS3Abin06_02871 [bacterium BMS3Abin06]HDH12927.1 hypothetical protein [Nitrospirota bacterium]HDL19852.1 hypothetical protein [Nitrospirota bacterium]HDZ01661.1 hypothetical protein [Nitrospirota bacterium]
MYGKYFILPALVIMAVLVASPVMATDYYVSYSTGNDSNDGLSESAPWQNIGKVNAQTLCDSL